MKKLLLCTLAGIALASSSALAADMAAKPYYKAPAPAPAWSWTGFYFGGGFGYGMYDQGTTPVGAAGALTGAFNNGGQGWTGQVKVGADYQFNSNIVAGVFADYDPSNIKGNFSTGGATGLFSPIDGQEKLRSSWAVGGRIGWLITPTVLSYFNGGYTSARFGSINATSFGIPAIAGTVAIASHNYNGFFAGGGVEAPITFVPLPGLFFYTEYRYAYYNSPTLAATPGGGLVGLTGETIRPNVQTVVSGVDYRFNWTGR